MIPSKLRTAAAKFSLEIVRMDELIEAANHALDQGLDTPSLSGIVTQYRPNVGGTRLLFVEAMNELGMVTPEPKVAAGIVILDAAYLIVERTVEPAQVVGSLLNRIIKLEFDTEITCEVIRNHQLFHQWQQIYMKINERHNATCGYGYWDENRPKYMNYGVDPQADTLIDNCVAITFDYLRTHHLTQLQPAYLTPTVRGLVSAIREDCAFDRLPILADALQEAGCEHEEILTHLREQNPHERCCWVAELLAEVT